jgi:hypothetical protein
MARIFKLDPSSVVATLENGAFYVFNHPLCYNSPSHLVHGQNAWLVDYSASCWPRGPILPLQIWLPQGEGERETLVEDAQFRVPTFFVNRDGSLGVPITNAGHMQLRDGHLAQSVSDNSSLKIRLAVCTASKSALTRHCVNRMSSRM